MFTSPPLRVWVRACVSVLLVGLLSLQPVLRLIRSTQYSPAAQLYSLPLQSTGWVKMHIEDTVHYQLNGPSAAEEYASMLPPGGHLVFVGAAQHPHTVALFHQLHCLNIVREAYIHVDEPNSLARHCMNYLRQTILCLADTRLELVRRPSGNRVTSFSSDYICRNWTAVYEAAAAYEAV
ncbi:hypothetical protein NEOLEDRAFT_1086546 [Neolentinus lepideus HHB14362 ss-1]|uniref:Uncharacterized protein n=1 Tax=Neolentinus lepideus HHB14362 ss-1 TaxID=1314782 RepID=A0A165UX90_9AGAM|nr:hypothetical protein NEOLEDRAFT_1086546 [Neolentinus lepideus HHB14362 ss-1]